MEFLRYLRPGFRRKLFIYEQWMYRRRYSLLYLFAFLLFILFCLTLKTYFDLDYQLFSGFVTKSAFSRAHYLCVLVPYRNREQELNSFIPYIHDFLIRQEVLHHIIVLNQTDVYRFNRASLINVGWFEAERVGCDYMVMHDVDLLPLNHNLSYSFPGLRIVRHISAPQYHPRYNYSNFIGGILMLTLTDFKNVNGMSNKYWGWGLEDDEFFVRLKLVFSTFLNKWIKVFFRKEILSVSFFYVQGSNHLSNCLMAWHSLKNELSVLLCHGSKGDLSREAGLTDYLERPSNLTTNRRNTFLHNHNASVRKRDMARIGNQKKFSRLRDRVSGLNTVRYNITSRNSLFIPYKNSKCLNASVLNIELECDLNWTPYCIG